MKIMHCKFECDFEAVQIFPKQLTKKDCDEINEWLRRGDYSDNRIVLQGMDGEMWSEWFLHTARHSDVRGKSGDYIVKLYGGDRGTCGNFIIMSSDAFKNLNKLLFRVFKDYPRGYIREIPQNK